MNFNKYGLKSKNILLVYIGSFFAGMLFFMPILALYLEESLFTLANVGIVYAVRAISVAIFEYPTGAIADLIGRKKSLVLGNASVLLATIFLFIGGNLSMFLIYAVVVAFGIGLFSGADSALIYDTLKEERKEKYFKKIIGMKYALWPVGASIGSIIGGYLAAISYSTAVLLSLAPTSIALLTVLFLKEPKYEKETHRNIFKHMFKSSKIIIKSSQLIILLIGALIFVGIGDSVHVLKPIFFQFKEIPLVAFGYIYAISFGLSSIGHYFSHEISEKIGTKNTVLVSAFILTLFIFLATFVSPWLAVACLLVKQFSYGLGRPVTDYLLNQETSSKTRATVISGYNLLRHVGIAIFVPLIAWVAEGYTINMGFRIGAIIMFSIPILFLFLKEKRATSTTSQN